LRLIKNLPRVQLSRFVSSTVAHGVHREMGLVAEGADETQGWLEFIEAAELMDGPELKQAIDESTELTKIISASYGTAKANERAARHGKATDNRTNQSR
jgi:hypothetical protein